MFDHILVPTDLSDFAQPALRYAAEFAERFGSQVTLLHASAFASSMYAYPLGYYFDNVPTPKLAVQDKLRHYARTHFPNAHHVDTIVIDGDPAEAIARTADDVGADLIIMATHGRRFHSVTERVQRLTHRPVLTVVPQPEVPRPRSVEPRNLVTT